MYRERVYKAVIIIISLVLLSGCQAGKNVPKQEVEASAYKLQNIDMKQEEMNKTIEKLRLLMEDCRMLYRQRVKGEDNNVTLSEEDVHDMAALAAESGKAVTCESNDCDMLNYEKVDACLTEAEQENTETEFYVINTNGIFRYRHLEFEEGDLYITSASAVFDEDMKPQIQQMEKIRAYRWEYTEKGWLIWEKALSRNQEMDMHIFCRILPLGEQCREITEQCIRPVSYFCNNLFLEEWDEDNLQKIEFSDLFEFLYAMSEGVKLDETDYPEGVPKEEFEAVICRYFDITPEELEQYAEYDKERGVYPRSAVGCWNRIPQFQPFPEVVRCKEHEDGTITAYVEAVYREEGMDCAFRHEVTLRLEEGRGWVYMGNKIDYETAAHIPSYRARKEYK